jgi:hypothetical protein
MSDYTKATNFLSKDSLITGDPLKIVRGSEFDVEFKAIETAIATKANIADTYTQAAVDAAITAAKETISKLTSYDAATAAGNVISVAAGFTVNTGLAVGDTFGIYNDSAANITITQGAGVTLRLLGTTSTGNRTIPPRGLAVLYAHTTAEYLLGGGGVY